MPNLRFTAESAGYDWSRFGRHRLRAPGGVLIDSPLGFQPHGWLGTLWRAQAEPVGWARMLWQFDAEHGGWMVPNRLAGGDVFEFGADQAGQLVRWYGIVDCYDAVEWLTVQGPYPDPAAAFQHAEVLLAQLRYSPPVPRRSQNLHCTRRRADQP